MVKEKDRNRLSLIILWAVLLLLFVFTFVQARSVRHFFWVQGEKLVRARPLRHNQPSTLEFALIQFDATNWRRTIIYLPKDYDRSGRTRYPLVVFLHGVPGRETDWLNPSLGDAQKTIDQAISQRKIRPFIAVFPAGGSTFTDDTQYINAADGKNNNEDFIYKNVVNYIDSHYNTDARPVTRAIIGASSGAFGALNITVHHQEVFHYALSFSGYSTIESNEQSDMYLQDSNTVRDYNSLDVQLPKQKSHDARFWLLVGDHDPYGLTDWNVQIQRMFKENGFTSTLNTIPGGHGWEIWRPNLINGLLWLERGWSGQERFHR